MDGTVTGSGLHWRYRFGSAEFDEARLELRVGGLAVEVQQKPLQLLALLLATPGAVVTKDEIASRVWNHQPTVENVIANAVSKLRSALGDDNARRIVTAPRQGYRLDGPVERMAVGRRLASRMALLPGQPVPGRENFVLAALLGSSHTGDTWLARHAKTGAARVYKFGTDGERLAGLKREVTLYRVLRESLGERDDIARILDWNFEQLPYFLECEYGGASLLQWAQEGADGATRLSQLPPGERLALMLQVIDAVAAAHGVGVLHKDLKPANVLVYGADGGWRARLTDFGSGRLLDPGRVAALQITQLGMTLASDAGSDSGSGTPYYLAPELSLGQAPTARSDVYALGVMLYQVLAGDLRRQMAPGWERDMADELLREDIMCATDVDPQRRMSSAAELAQRLRDLEPRHAVRQAQRAADISAQRVQQALARSQARRPWVAAALLALLLGVAASLWLYSAERHAAAALAQQFALSQSLNRLLNEGLIAAANPAASGRADITVAEALTGAAAAIDTRFSGQGAAVRAGLHQSMQSALSELSRAQDAVVEGRRALAAFGADPAPDFKALQDVRIRLALDLVQLSKLDEAAAVMREVERDAGPPAAQQPEFRARLLYVKSWLTGGDLSLKESLAYGREAWALVEPLNEAQAPWRDKILFALADTLSMLGDAAQSEVLYRRLLAGQTRTHGAGSAQTYYTMVGLANVIGLQNRRAEAIAMLTEAAQGLSRKLGPRHRMTLTATDMLATLHLRQGDYARAIDEWSQVHGGYSALMGEGSSYAITVQTNLGVARQRGGHAAEAEPVLRSALARVRHIVKDADPQAQQVRYALADCLLDLRKPAEVDALLEGLDAEALNTAQQEPDWEGQLAYQRGRLALQRGKAVQAREQLEQALRLLASHPSSGRTDASAVRRLLDHLPPAPRLPKHPAV
jgi:non-specific serine/threonine protein kinase